MENETQVPKTEPVTNKAICEEKPFFFKGKQIMGYFPVNDPDVKPQFEAVYQVIISTPQGPKIPVRKSVILKGVETIKEAFDAFDEAVQKDAVTAQEDIRKQMLRDSLMMGHHGQIPKGAGKQTGTFRKEWVPGR